MKLSLFGMPSRLNYGLLHHIWAKSTYRDLGAVVLSMVIHRPSNWPGYMQAVSMSQIYLQNNS